MFKLPKMNPETRAIWLFFWLKRKLGLSQLGRPARPPARPTRRDLKGLELRLSEVQARKVYVLEPKEPKRQMLYLHGGGYVQPIAKQHWQFLAKIARESQCRVMIPLYGLAPKHTVDDALTLLDEVAAGFDELPLVVGGDSAGGGLALAWMQRSRLKSKVKLLLLISPWVDADFDSEEARELEKVDPWLSSEALGYIATVWSNTGNKYRPEVSPLRGELGRLPATEIFSGQVDLLHPQIIELSNRLSRDNGEVELFEVAGALHVYPLIPTKEGLRAQAVIVEALNRV